MNELEKDVILQMHDKEGYEQFTITLPSQFVKLFGWEKGNKLKVTQVLGSGKLVIERCE